MPRNGFFHDARIKDRDLLMDLHVDGAQVLLGDHEAEARSASCGWR